MEYVGCMFALAVFAFGFFMFITRGLSPGGRALYFLTFVFELVSIPARLLVGAVIAPLILFAPFVPLASIAIIYYAITRDFRVFYALGGAMALLAAMLGIIIAFAPHVRSILYMMGLRNGNDWLTRLALRARRLSRTREEPVLKWAESVIAPFAPKGMKKPWAYFVIPSRDPRILVVGTALYIAKPLLHEQREHLPAVLAQALGYINSGDRRLIGALRGFSVAPMHLLAWAMRDTAPGQMIVRAGMSINRDSAIITLILLGAVSLAGGGIGSLLLSPAWSMYWKRAQVRHDAFAAGLGQRQNLINYIDWHQMYEVPVPFFMSDSEDSELRVEALMELPAVTGKLAPQP